MATVIRGDDNFDSADYGGLGHNQTWSALVASRAASTTYTNTTGRTIAISIRGSVSSTSVQDVSVTVGGQAAWVRYAGTYTGEFNAFTVVPAGLEYYLTLSNGAALVRWEELR